MKPTPNTWGHRPEGKDWLHVVRRPPLAQAGRGMWYANVDRESEAGERAHQFAVWFEYMLRERAPGRQPLPRSRPVTLWAHLKPPLTALALRRPAVWRAIEDLLPEVARESFDAWGWPGTSTLYGRDLGCFDPALEAASDANLFMAQVYDIDDERVTILWMPRLDQKLVQLTQEDLTRTAEELKKGTPDIARLEEVRLPRPPREDARFSRVERSLDPSGVAPFFEDARKAVGAFHDKALDVLGGYLHRLVGQALPTLEDNKSLAQGVLALCDTFGAALFFRTVQGEIKQVRIRAVPVARLKGTDSPAARAGKFAIHTVGANPRSVSDSVTFPLLVAARDLDQASGIFARIPSAEGRHGAE